jgi:integrase
VGTVCIESVNRRLRLRFFVDGLRRAFSLKMEDTKDNRIRAALVARQIEVDILSNTFDHSLQRYKPSAKLVPQNLTVTELFDNFIAYKATGGVRPSTLDKYKALLNHLRSHKVGSMVAKVVGPEVAKEFSLSIKDGLAPAIYKERIGLLAACWRWAKLPLNPWGNIYKSLRARKPPPKPFTTEEVRDIIAAFRGHKYYHHYADFVEFLFLSGVRTGEARGLTWGNVAPDFKSVLIAESMTKGERIPTKTGKIRRIPLCKRLRQMLAQRKPIGVSPDDLVFPSLTGLPIDELNFAKRAWKSTLQQLGITYRRPYLTRSTFVSHMIAAGVSPVVVAAISGHSLRVLYESYAGVVTNVEIPDLY